jgi:hypothetical protein
LDEREEGGAKMTTLALVATHFGAVSLGFVLGWIACALPKMEEPDSGIDLPDDWEPPSHLG